MARMIQMVGPLSSEEIEDVVSSVRRLVSNEQRPRPLSRDLNTDRLLLTPALRVVTEASPLAPLILAVPLTEQPVAPEPLVEPVDPGLVVDVPVGADDWDEEIWETPQTTLAEAALGAEEAEVLCSASDATMRDELVGAFAAEPEDLPAPWAQVETEWEEDEPVTFVPLRRRAENLTARIASAQTETAPEGVAAAVSEVETILPPTAPATVPEAEDGFAAVDAVKDQVPETAREPELHSLATEFMDADGSPIAVLDESALQDIVRQMIREELQGVLGERITRNVRKLVRAEINRALVARDLD